MKMLSIRQPWASLICAGIKDVEVRTWKPKHRGKLLIHASSAKCPKNFFYQLPAEMQITVLNEEFYGNFDKEALPTSSILGYVDLVDCVEGEYDSIWSDPGCVNILLENVHMFDEPITGVNGKLNIFEYDMDENALPPSHKVVRRAPRIEGDEIIVPISDPIMANFAEEGSQSDYVTMFDTPDVVELFCDTDEKGYISAKQMEGIKRVTLVAKDGTKLTFPFREIVYEPVRGEDDEPIKLPSLYSEEEVEVWQVCVVFERK